MKKLSIMVVVVLSLCLVTSFALAAHHMKKGTLTSVDAAKSSIVVNVDGKDQTMSVIKGVDLGSVKAGDKVEIEMDKDMVKSIKKSKPKAVIGC